jgi:hypothetical protein
MILPLYMYLFLPSKIQRGSKFTTSPAFIETQGIPRIVMEREQGNDAPLLIAGFKIKNTGQSNLTASVQNRISVSLYSFASLSSSNISKSGLIGSSTPDNDNLKIHRT